MQTTIWASLKQSLAAARQWYEQTPERALDQAYAAALMIKSIEDEHFDGDPISVSTEKYGANSNAVFQEELRKCLKIATLRLSEFKASRFIFNTTDASGNALKGPASLANKERSAIVLEKLKFIDEVLARYQTQQAESLSLVPVDQNGAAQLTQNDNSPLVVRPNVPTGSQRLSNGQTIDQLYQSEPAFNDETGIFDKSGVLPRTIASTLSRIKRDLDPNSEQQMVRSFRSTKAKNTNRDSSDAASHCSAVAHCADFKDAHRRPSCRLLSIACFRRNPFLILNCKKKRFRNCKRLKNGLNLTFY